MSSVQQRIKALVPERFAGARAEKAAEATWPFTYDSIEVVTVLTDIVVIVAASIVAGAAYHLQAFGAFGNLASYMGAAAVVSALFVLGMKSRGLYDPPALLSLRGQLVGVCLVWGGVFLLLAAAVFALKIGEELSRGANVSFAAVGLVVLLAHRVAWKGLLARGIAERKYAGRKIVLITGDFRLGVAGLPNALKKLGFRIEHHFTLPAATPGSRKHDEFVARVTASVRGSDVEEIVVGADPSQWSELYGLVAGLRILPLPVSLVPIGPLSDVFRRRARVLGNKICIELQRGPLSRVECVLKRGLDLAIATAALVALALPLLVVAAVIKLDSAGPVLFRQRRCGFNGRCFQIFKFRTMTVLEDGATIRQVHGADARITRVGKWLRRTSIDELPQLFNVLEGTMSLVGPRPHAVAHDIEFDKLVRNYAFRHRVKPGLTGWAQVNGCRGSTPTPESIERRVKYDLWYIDNWSFGLDFAILLQTAVEVVRGRNAV